MGRVCVFADRGIGTGASNQWAVPFRTSAEVDMGVPPPADEGRRPGKLPDRAGNQLQAIIS